MCTVAGPVDERLRVQVPRQAGGGIAGGVWRRRRGVAMGEGGLRAWERACNPSQ